MEMHEYENTKKPTIIAVSGGKGGTGKTNVAINLGISLAKASQKVMLLDADFGLANIDVLLGIQSKYNLSNVISGDKNLSEIIIKGPSNLEIIPASSGNKDLAQINIFTLKTLIDSFSSIEEQPDYLIIDTSAGITDSVVSLLSASDEIILVVCNEPASLTDAYALIKLMHNKYHKNNFKILPNKITKKEDSKIIFNKLTYVTDKYLNVSMRLMDGIFEDQCIKKANLVRQPVVTEFPNSISSIVFKYIAKQILNWPKNNSFNGSFEFFQRKYSSFMN